MLGGGPVVNELALEPGRGGPCPCIKCGGGCIVLKEFDLGSGYCCIDGSCMYGLLIIWSDIPR